MQLDQMQGNALNKALSQSFCVVQGVAGSGKTVILARQAYIFSRINRTIYDVRAFSSVIIVCTVMWLMALSEPMVNLFYYSVVRPCAASIYS